MSDHSTKKVRMGSRKFIDSVRLVVRGGSGGMGLPKYGGVGGKGGNIYLEASKKEQLSRVQSQYRSLLVSGGSGEDSKKSKIFAEAGEDKVISVPVGITIYDAFDRKLGELNEPGERMLIANGGHGGSPASIPAYSGGKGEEKTITLDLKLIADVGLVGFPNAGKSTLLKAISRANPKIAAYAFTTLRPNLGTIQFPDHRQIQVADLPGLIEGASYNLGMGHKFLKHIERTKMILMVADVQGFQMNPAQKYRTCLETVLLLNKELELYKEELLDKPAVLLINKMDLPGSAQTLRDMKPYLLDLAKYVSKLPDELKPNKVIKFEEIVPISAKTDPESAEKVKEVIRTTLDIIHEESIMHDVVKTEAELMELIEKENTEFRPKMM